MFRRQRDTRSQEARALDQMHADPRDETCMHGVPFPCGLCHPRDGYNGLPVTRTASGTYAAARVVETAPPLGPARTDDSALYEECLGRPV